MKRLQICGRGAGIEQRFYCSGGAFPGVSNTEGGIWGSLFNPEGKSTTPSPPGAAQNANYYLNLLRGYEAGVPSQLATENQSKPGFIDATLRGVNQTSPDWLSLFGTNTGAAVGAGNLANTGVRTAGVSDAATLGPGAAAAVRAVNPTGSALTDQLATTASKELSAGTQLDPASVNRITQATRADWAGRGLGDSNPAQLNEAVNLATEGQSVLNQREGNAAQAAAAEQSLTNPALALVTKDSNAPVQGQTLLGQEAALSQGAGPTLVSPAASQDIFSTGFNAIAGANIAGANNQAALDAY